MKRDEQRQPYAEDSDRDQEMDVGKNGTRELGRLHGDGASSGLAQPYRRRAPHVKNQSLLRGAAP